MVRSELKDTKTGQARAVDLTDRTLGILERLRQSAPEIRPLEPIFLNPLTGGRWADGGAQRNLYLNKAMSKLGIYGHVAYHTRHTYASLALIGGVNVAYLARQLGHANAGMLFKHYARWIEDDEATRQSKRLNEAFTAADSPISGSQAASR